MVKRVYWAHEARDGELLETVQRFTDLDSPTDASTFVAYEQITKQWTIDQISAQVDVQAMQAELTVRIQEKANSSTIAMAPPFAD